MLGVSVIFYLRSGWLVEGGVTVGFLDDFLESEQQSFSMKVLELRIVIHFAFQTVITDLRSSLDNGRHTCIRPTHRCSFLVHQSPCLANVAATIILKHAVASTYT